VNRESWWEKQYRRVLRVPDPKRELDEELAFHLQMKASDLERAGLSPREAEAEAKRLFGSLDEVHSTCSAVDRGTVRRRRRRTFLEGARQDLVYGLRSLWRTPWLSLMAVVALAVGIGATTAAWSVVNGVLLRLPVVDPDRVVELNEIWEDLSVGYNAPRNLEDYAEVTEVFERLAPFYADARSPVLLERNGARSLVASLFASSDLLPILGVEPAMGRWFAPEEDRLGAPPVAVVSHEFWMTELGGTPDVLGTAVTLGVDNWADLPVEMRPADYEPGYHYQSFTVVGVLPSDFELPPLPFAGAHGELGRSATLESGLFVDRPDVLLPYGLYTFFRDRRGFLQVRALGLLRAGVDAERGEEMLNRLAPGIEQSTLQLTTVRAIQREVYGNRLTRLAIAAVFLLLVSCASVAGILLARGSRRERECAVRASLGAGRMRLIRQLLTETGLIALGGCLAGIALAHWSTMFLASLAPGPGSLAEAGLVDGTVLAGALAVSLLALLLAGLVPAVHAVRPDLYAALSAGAATPSRSRRRLLNWIMVTQLATSTSLLVGTGLLCRSLLQVSRVDPGLRVDNITTVRLELLPPGASEYASLAEANAFLSDLVRRLKELPDVVDVQQVAVQSRSFWDRGYVVPYGTTTGPDAEPTVIPEIFEQRVTPGYFSLLSIRLRAGRTFTADDDARGKRSPPVLINESMARRHWPDGGAIGSEMRWGGVLSQGPFPHVVGIVEDVRFPSLDAEPPNQIYYAIQGGFNYFPPKVELLIETRTDPELQLGALRNALGGSDMTEPRVGPVEPLRAILHEALAPRRYQALLAGVAAATTLLIALLGLFGAISYSVARQTRETGMRKALGAPTATIVRSVVGEGMRLTLLGLALGMLGSRILTRVIQSELYGIGTLDPATYVSVGLTMLVTACLASYFPARRAGRLDPAAALRSD
jgi:putative ABC transport system permease protein